MIYDKYRGDFSALSSRELSEVERALKEAIANRKRQEVESLRNEFTRRASELGVDIKEVLGLEGKIAKKSVKKVQAKYRMTAPDGSVHEWSGRGIKPKIFAPYTKEELNSRFAIR